MADIKPVRTSAEVEVRREILDPSVSSAVTQVLENKHKSDERVKAERQERESYTAPDGDVAIATDNFSPQRGRALHSDEIVRRLKLANPSILFEPARNFPDIGGFYVVENRPDPVTNVAPWKRHICGMPIGEVWEFSKPLIVDEEIGSEDGLSVLKSNKLEGHVPGWRQILLRLVYDGVIQPADCEKYFHVSRGRSSQRWQQTQIS